MKRESGQGIVEYALILVLLALIIVVIIALFKDADFGKMFQTDGKTSVQVYIESQREIYDECITYEYEPEFCLKLVGR